MAGQEWKAVIKAAPGSFTADRAAFCIGNSYQFGSLEQQREGKLIWKKLAYSGRKNEFVYRAIINYGHLLLKEGKWDEALNLFKRIPKEETWAVQIAQEVINMHKNGWFKKSQ